MKFTYQSASLIISVLLLACGKGATEDDLNSVDKSDITPPVITITTPITNQAYLSGDSIIVSGFATDEKALKNGTVQIKKSLTGTADAETSYYTYTLPRIDFRLAYKAVVTVPTDFFVVVEFDDHGLNKTHQEVKVKVNP